MLFNLFSAIHCVITLSIMDNHVFICALLFICGYVPQPIYLYKQRKYRDDSYPCAFYR